MTFLFFARLILLILTCSAIGSPNSDLRNFLFVLDILFVIKLSNVSINLATIYVIDISGSDCVK